MRLNKSFFLFSLLSAVFSISTIFAVQPLESEIQRIYVDSQKGDDKNDGKSESTAVKSLQAAQDLLNEIPDDQWATLMMARGSVWRESNLNMRFTVLQRELMASYPNLQPTNERSEIPVEKKRWAPFLWGRKNLNLIAYGEGDKPTINGTDVLENSKFVQPSPEQFPNVWSQKVFPPITYYIEAFGKVTTRPGVIVDGKTPLWRIYTPLEGKVRDYVDKQEGIETEEDALKFLNENSGSFYARDNKDGSFDYFINAGSNPNTDGRLYEYKVRGSYFVTSPESRWEGIRYYGLNVRDGVSGKLGLLRDVEFLLGDVHNMLMGEGWFENVLSVGYRPQPPGQLKPWVMVGNTHSVFHTHQPNSRGNVYDRCTGRDASIAFYDHHADANREAIVIRDCVTENVNQIFSHGGSTATGYLIGHYHSGKDNAAQGHIGGLAAKQNFVEDSIFRVSLDSGWQADTPTMHMRNSVIYMTSGKTPLRPLGREDFVYENVTLILDFQGKQPSGDVRLATSLSKQTPSPAKLVFKNCVIAVINAVGLRDKDAAAGRRVLLGDFPGIKFENCVMSYMEEIPETAGEIGKDIIFASQEEIFSGKPENGDYSLNPLGPAAKADAGYSPARPPVFRAKADEAAAKIGQ